MTFWRVIVLPSYVVLGDNVNFAWIWRTARFDLVMKGCFNGSVYVDKGSGANRDG